MPNYKDRLDSSGGLNKDVSVEQLPAGDYPDALDISFLGDGVSASKSQTPKLGNKFAADRGSVSAQNKKYRLYIDLTASGTLSYQVTFYKTDTTTVLFTASFTNGSLSAADNAITNAAATAGYGINITNNGVFLLIEFAPMSGGVPTNYYDYFIVDTGTDPLDNLYVYQEAIDLTLVGENRAIGSFDLLGDLFIWSTSQTELPSDLGVTIYSITHTTVLTNIVIDFSSAHGLNTGERILVQGVEVLTGANGYWIVIATSTTQIQLAMSETVPQLGQIFTGTGSITINPSGIGEIGVSQKVQSTQNWTYTRLLRSKEWNWNTKKQFDTYCEQTATNRNLYGTNDYTPPMVFYYQTAFSTDGALSFNGGLYDYGTVFDETRLFLSVLNTRVEFTEQLQGGGALTAGNKRYAVRALTETATATDWSDVTNPVNVYAASILGDSEDIVGDVSGSATTKVNVLTITDIQTNIFKFIEVAVIEYSGLSVSGYIINRYNITGPTMVIQHTGNETTSQLDINEIQTFSIPIETAKNIRAIDNRLILSNLTTVNDIDLSDIANKITHSVTRTTVDSVYINGSNGVTYGEYQNPENVNDFVGYMINEIYRFSIRFRIRVGGGWTKNFWIDDIIIDNSATNTANPFNDNRRTSGLPDLALTLGNATFVPNLSFSNIDFNYILSDGTRLGDKFDAFSIERAECVPEILFTGIARMGTTEVIADSFNGSITTRYTFRPPMFVFSTAEDYNTLPIPPTSTITTDIGWSQLRDDISIYSPDILFGDVLIDVDTSDVILNYGGQLPIYITPTNSSTVNFFVEFMGRNQVSMTGFTPTSHNILEGSYVGNGDVFFMNGQTYNNYSNLVNEIQSGGTAAVLTDFPANFTTSVFAHLSTPLTNAGTAFDYGLYYIQYYRQRLDKYGDIPQTQYITCGNLYSTDGQNITSSFDVFGGDTFTQKTYIQISNSVSLSSNPSFGGGIANDGIGFFSQNRVNSQMRQKSEELPAAVPAGLTIPNGGIFPANTSAATINDRIFEWLADKGWSPEILSYDLGYNIQNSIDYHSAFDSDLINNYDQPTRIRWSPVKPQNAIADLYRVFLPFDFHDLDNSFGEITHHENVNGELFTLQPKKWQRQYFNTRGTLDVRGVSDVLIGDGSVMSRDGQTISNFGCQNKWSVIKGKSQGGNDTIYWIDLINRQAIRFGSDGTIGLSTIKGLQSFLANNLTWATSNDTPADGQGIHGWWHERFKEAIWVVRATRGVAGNLLSTQPVSIPQDWSATTNFVLGNVVYYASGTPNDFNEGQVFYRSLHNNNLGNLPTNVGWWEQISITDTDYYNYYSVAFNELKNRFTSFYTPLPKIAMQWNNGYLTPRPVGTQSRVYEHNKGEYSTWYAEGVDELTSEPYVDVIYNKDNSLSKSFLAFIATCQDVPYKVTFYTQNHETTSVAIDFKQYPTPPDFATAIKNDVLNTIAPPIGYSKLWGVWVKCRFYFANRTFNSLDGCVIKFTSINPIYQK